VIVLTFLLKSALCITIMPHIGVFELVADFECTIHCLIRYVRRWQRLFHAQT
jgi:hypothetical protein